MSQTEQLLAALKRGPVTPLDALRDFGCFRLAARVEELRKSGFNVVTEMAEANGKRFARYRLVGQMEMFG